MQCFLFNFDDGGVIKSGDISSCLVTYSILLTFYKKKDVCTFRSRVLSSLTFKVTQYLHLYLKKKLC